MTEEKEEKEEKKTSSRKFLVWITWLVILIASIVVTVVAIVISNGTPQGVFDLVGNVINNFFVISMMYLGMNVTQKGLYTLKDIFKPKITLDEEVKETKNKEDQ